MKLHNGFIDRHNYFISFIFEWQFINTTNILVTVYQMVSTRWSSPTSQSFWGFLKLEYPKYVDWSWWTWLSDIQKLYFFSGTLLSTVPEKIIYYFLNYIWWRKKLTRLFRKCERNVQKLVWLYFRTYSI